MVNNYFFSQQQTCVISVEDLGDGRYGKIRIVDGNDAYVSSIENPAPGVEMLVDKFIPNSEYTNYLTRDLNFEDYCYRAAVGRKCLHSYAKPDRMPGVMFNMTFLPVGYEEGNLRYCTYTMEINFEVDSKRLSNISADIASAVLETSLKIRTGKDFKVSITEVIKDIRELCDAEQCCILLMNHILRLYFPRLLQARNFQLRKCFLSRNILLQLHINSLDKGYS